MRLIVDAGSTKMEWILLDGNEVKSRFLTKGFNPNYADIQTLVLMFNGVSLPSEIQSIHYYGTKLPINKRGVPKPFSKGRNPCHP